MRNSDFKQIQNQIAEYQNKIKDLQKQSIALSELEYRDVSDDKGMARKDRK